MNWHAVYVQTSKEDIVHKQILKLLEYYNYTEECELIVPKRKLKEQHKGKTIDVYKIMFPGYILVKTNNPWDVYQKVRQLENLYRFLSSDYQIQEIHQSEIANIINMVDEKGVIGISDIFIENDIIKVTDGPLCNYTGLIKKLDKHKQRVKVLFKFQGQDRLIDLSVNILRKPNEEELNNNY